jgi:hypothetical protein
MAKLSEFGQAFAAARKAGEKTFEFKGKKYGTKLASEVEQPSVGGKVKAGEYKSRDNRSPFAPTLVEGTKRTSMARKPDDETMAKSGETRRIRNMMDSAAEATGAMRGARLNSEENTDVSDMMKRGGKVKGYAKGGVTRADGCVTKGHTKGKMV